LSWVLFDMKKIFSSFFLELVQQPTATLMNSISKQVISLITSNKYSEKSVGYLATAVLLNSSDNLMTLVVRVMTTSLHKGVSLI
jgi:hypothetical protein